MAKADAPSFDDLTKVDPSNDNDDEEVPTVKLDAGEDLVAELRHIERDVGQHGNDVLHLTDTTGDPCKMWSNRTISRALDEADVSPGDVIGIRKDSEPYTFETTDDDGNTVEREAFGFEVGVLED